MGNISFKIRFEGKRYNPEAGDEEGFSPERQIIQGYGDKISFSYYSRHNVVRISVRKSLTAYHILTLSSIALAIVVYFPISVMMDADAQANLLDNYVFPLEGLFGNAMLMVAAPVTLFSLLKNISDVFIISEAGAPIHRLQRKTMITSIVCILLAMLVGFGLDSIINGSYAPNIEYDTIVGWTFAEVVSSIVPSSIVAPFELLSPFPLIVVALLITYAMRRLGKYFDVLKTAIDTCYELFSLMLRAIMVLLPIFCFLAFLDVLLDDGFRALFLVASIIGFVILSLSILLATYAIRLRVRGIQVLPFVKKLVPLLKENYRIGSVIDAVPFNVRYCAKHYGMNRDRIRRGMQVLAQTNLDGNCFLIMLIALIYISAADIYVSWVNIAVIGLLVLFLSYGAPNQPGSILIGTLIIINYLHSYEMLPMAIYVEVFLGSVQNCVNVISDIVMLAEEEKRAQLENREAPAEN